MNIRHNLICLFDDNIIVGGPRSSSPRFFFPSPTTDSGSSSAGNDVVANVANMVANQGVVSSFTIVIINILIMVNTISGEGCPAYAPPCDARPDGDWHWDGLQVEKG